MEHAPIPIPPQSLVVVGASAGGVDALSSLVASLPLDLPAAVVVAQHLDPNRPSRLAEILGNRSTLPLRTVEGREPLAPATVYIVPANRHVVVEDGHVTLRPDGDRPAPSIDRLLQSAAAAYGDRLVAVVLSGSGSDGAAGAHAVKEAGGTVVIQDPDTAAFPSMPRSLARPLVDAVAPVERIGPLLAVLLDHPVDTSPGDAESDAALAALLARVRERRGIDFSTYKAPTIRRRLRRRMAAAGVDSLPAYLRLIEADPAEEQRLVADFLIKVTRFFRDAAIFEELRDRLVPELMETAARERRELRLWSAGCATGEEAYSLALIVADHLASGAYGNLIGVRIFATDIDEDAVAFARRGIYPAATVDGLPSDLVARHFTEYDDGLEVRKEVRSLIVFGSHDLGQRPPFPHTDLVLCRNVLIYFTPELQRRALDIFAYSLRDGGYLVLGKSETPGPNNRLFAPVSRQLRLYRREGPRTILLPDDVTRPLGLRPVQQGPLPTLPPLPTLARSDTARSAAMDHVFRQVGPPGREAQLLGVRAEELIRRLPVGVVVVDRRYDIESINGAARELLGIHGTALGQDLIHLAQRVPSTDLRAAIDAVTRDEPPQTLETVVTTETATAETRFLSIACHPLRMGPAGEVESVMVVVTDVSAAVTARRRGDEEIERLRGEVASLRATTERMALVNRQLLAANRELTDTVDVLREQGDELRAATAAAQVSAEEIETLNEELQSSNEELETLHEESQATVEELNVANEELQARATELEEMAATHASEQARLSAILASMSDAVAVVDRQARPVLVNDAYRRLVSGDDPFLPADQRGAPLPPATTPQARVSRGEDFWADFTAAGPDGSRRWFEAIGRPLPGGESGVLVIRDITDRSLRHLQEEFLSWAGHELRTPLAALQSYLQLAARRAGPEADERLRSSLTSAVAQTRRQAVLIDELLDASRLRSGRLSLNRSRLDLTPLVHRVAETAQVLAAGQTIVVEAPGSPVEVDVDAGRFEQVLLNLLTNAIAYAPGTDRIEVRVETIRDAVEVSVRDHGPGISPDALGVIFEQFGRAAETTHAGSGGLGLGLYIAREIVRAHDGDITVGSTPGQGATFVVRLPVAAPDGRAPTQPGGPA